MSVFRRVVIGNRSRALMQRGRFTPLQRELIAVAVSAANACVY